jgi:hydrogenase expression/formation protein HypC
MCVATPMRLVELHGDEAIAEQGGVTRKVSIALLESAKAGDFVLIHAGFAIAIIDEEEALLDIEAIAACAEEGDGSPP